MHAPMYILVSGVISAKGHNSSASESPAFEEKRDGPKRHHSGGNDCWTVPPSHGNGVFVLFFNKMIRFVGLKNLVVNHRVALEWVHEKLHRAVHDEAVKSPFKEGAEDGGDDKSNCGPFEK